MVEELFLLEMKFLTPYEILDSLQNRVITGELERNRPSNKHKMRVFLRVS